MSALEDVSCVSSNLEVAKKIDAINREYMTSLAEISDILNETDISSFEMIHSGLIEHLVGFLSVRDTVWPNMEKKIVEKALESFNTKSMHKITNIKNKFF